MKLDDTYGSVILSELMDCVDDVVLIMDAKLRVRRANRVASILLGYPAEALAAKSLPALIDEGERERTVALVQGTKERRGGETVFLTRCRARVPASFSLSALKGAGPGRRGYLLVGRRSEDRSLPPNADASNGLAARMLKGFANPLLIIDGPSRTVRDCNEAALSAYGFTREELVGRRLMGHCRSAEERKRNQDLERRADRTYATAGIFQERVLLPRKNAPSLPCDLTGLPFFRPDGALELIIVMLFDRSSEVERESELTRLIGQVGGLAVKLSDLASAYSAGCEEKRLSDLGFTSRQIEIARLGATGASSKEIGFRLGIAESTVKSHLAAMYRRLGVNSRIGFIRSVAVNHIKID
jgi:DNA-binding CsgD family transcriptional regulator/PAS domain-containing protein